MRDFVIVNKEDTTKKATLRVDMVEDKTEKLTIMWCDGVRDTEFEKIIPWKCGTVTSMTEIEEWATQYQSELVRRGASSSIGRTYSQTDRYSYCYEQQQGECNSERNERRSFACK